MQSKNKTQAIFLEASATLPKSSLYSNEALFSEQKTFSHISEVNVRTEVFSSGLKDSRSCQGSQFKREEGCEDEAR